jgi:HEAT repeat protein
MVVSLKGAAADNLGTLLRRSGLEARVVRLLDARSLRLKLIAATALGALREESAWEPLVRLARAPDPALSLAAARALLRIAPAPALQLLSRDILARDDWALARVGATFRELGPDAVTVPLARLIASHTGRGLARAVSLVRFGHRGRLAPIVRARLVACADAEVLAAGLDYAEGEDDARRVLAAARHGDWRVRMAAARALGRVGSRADAALLRTLLGDSQWWVRYQAARSLARLHGISRAELDGVRADPRDRYASDMLTHALADLEATPWQT